MRKVILVLVTIFSIISCQKETKKSGKEKGYTINGYTNSLNSSKAYLFDSNNTLADSAIISNNKFQFKGISNGVNFNTILFIKDSLSVDVLLENNDFQLYASINNQLVFGGNAQQNYNTYLEGLNKLEKSKLAIFNTSTIKTSIATQIDNLNSKIYNYKLNSLKSISSTPIKSKILNSILNNDALSINQLIEIKTITDKLDNAKIVENVNTALENLKAIELEKEQQAIKIAKENTPKRQLAPMFAGEGLNGADLSLATVLNGKKAVLIDFWASWCGPCREVTPQVKSIYDRYKSKGFDIVTVSEDRNRAAWKSGIAEDQMLSWNHIYDDNMRIAYMFNVSSIPHMVLVDGNGGIIDRKISAYRLENELKKILK
ncbi:protein of unknown function [Lutibacter oricola]|uniref:Thioredoxin domain-containing protein n=1 Tax=Lutibacter oricola TaxID=762486 RepID=A0A1H2XG13_9FLAO|nr:TlpA disulfide reductase family protein [Lutibacter oricola]SDW91179.1 protein of unknown function [Lutibacter oricola]